MQHHDAGELTRITTTLAHPMNPIHEHTTTWNEVLVLAALDSPSAPDTMTGLARVVGLSRAAMTTCADRLEDQDLLERILDRSDRRRIQLRITDNGRNLISKAFGFDAAAADQAVAAGERELATA